MKNARGIRALLLAMLFVLTRSAVSAQTLPSPWANRDIGAPKIAGSATHSSGSFTVTAAGSDIWGTSDQFHFVYEPVTGDVEVVARVVSITTQAHRWSKTGVMIRESLTAESRHAMMSGSAAAGFAFQRRVQTAGSSDSTAGPANAPPGWVRLVRKGDLFSAYHSTDGVNWRIIGSDTIPMGDTVYVGLPVTSHNASVTATAKIDSVKVIAASLPNQPPAVSVTAPIANSQYTAPASININATATDPEGAMLSVDFYANQTLIMRDTTAPYSATFATSTPGSYSLTAVAHDADGNSTTSGAVPVTVQAATNQVPTVSLTLPTNGAQFSAPATISLAANASDPENQLARVEFYSGTTLLGSDTSAPYSFSWTNVAAGTYSLTVRAYDSGGASATSAAVSVTVTAAAGGLPTGMVAADVGSPAITGQTSYSNGTYTVRGGGMDIWDPVDQFQFAYQRVTGDTEIVARVVSLTNTDSWAKAGVMIRETLTGASQHAMLGVTPTAATGAWFGRRKSGTTVRTIQGTTTAPAWVRLVRTGNVITASWSTNGTTWTLVGSDTVTMASTVYVGLVANSHSATAATTVVFDNVSIKTGSSNQPPTVALMAPANGATFAAPATINLTATASDPENQLARVEFLNGTTLLVTDTTAPYSYSWTNVPAGTYALTAKAYDTAGASATSATVSVTVQSPSNQVPTVSLTAPANGATFTAPATLNLVANASDPENQLARVEFLSGTTVLGTDTTAPYSFSWTNVAAGTYSLTAKAYDSGGVSATSAAVSVTVTAATGGLPTGMVAADVGSPAITGQTSYSNGTYTVRGGGMDIWDPVDQFQFAYQRVTGDTEIVARVVSLTNTDSWAKAAVMIRETLTGNSRHATLAITPTSATGAWFGRRLQSGGTTVRTIQGTTTAPAWVRLVRAGNVITGYWSTNGTAWTLVGSDTVTMASTVYVGLVANSHNATAATTVVFDNVSIKTGSSNQAPTVTLTAPANGAQFTAPASIALTATASDPENQLLRVEFLNGTTVLATDTTAPFAWTWSNVAAGTYSLTAKAYDSAGAAATSAAVTVTVGTTTTSPPRYIVFIASADHATNVTSYLFKVFAAGANPATAIPIVSSDLGKPTPDANNEITVDRSALFNALAAGSYIATVTAIGPGGQTQSAPVSFTR
jgi:regulation of enolase protein 1 (concanavalin A-like superfamily)